MSLLTLIKSASRFGPAMCLIVVAFAITTQALMAQGQSQLSCHEIAVIGAVKLPGRFEIPARIRLLGALALVGGPTERAGKVVSVVHSCQCSPCAEGEVKTATPTEYSLSGTLQGREDANPFVSPGEIIIVPEAESVWVIGNVVSQKSFIYREGVSLTQAIAMVGGVGKNSDLVRIRIYRIASNGLRPDPLIFTLKAVLGNRGEDPVLQPSDIIEISDETGRFNSPFTPPLYDPPLMHSDKEPPLVKRNSSNS
jgi:SLBB domain